MKIKTVKKLNLPELIQHVWEKEDYPNRFVNNFNGEVVFNGSGKFMTDDSFISHNSLFTVEVTEELTEETEFDWLLMVSHKNHIQIISPQYTTIQGARHRYNMAEKLYTLTDGEVRLIWSRESGIPESGVLEVDVK